MTPKDIGPEGRRHRAHGGVRAAHHGERSPKHESRLTASTAGYRIWLEQNGTRVFGPGTHQLLLRVKECGSLSRAARELGMSYTKAWHMVQKVEQRLGVILLDRHTGGADGGGSSLTEEAALLLERFDACAHEADLMLNDLFAKHFADTAELCSKEPETG